MLHYISTTCSGSLHYMRNDYRAGRRQVSFVVDEALWGATKGLAAARGMSVTAFVTGLLEAEVMPDVQPDTPASPLAPATPTTPDWDSIMERGRASRVVVVSDTVSGSDPLEEIA